MPFWKIIGVLNLLETLSVSLLAKTSVQVVVFLFNLFCLYEHSLHYFFCVYFYLTVDLYQERKKNVAVKFMKLIYMEIGDMGRGEWGQRWTDPQKVHRL